MVFLDKARISSLDLSVLYLVSICVHPWLQTFSMPFKLGVVPYLNPLPLYFSLRNRRGIEITADFPAKLGARLQNGEFDAALLPVADHIRGIGDGILSDAIVGASKQVRSVLLFSKVEIEEIRSIALDTSSHSSVALIQILLRDFIGITPKYRDAPPDLSAMLAQNDAALLIGDPALLAARSPGVLHVFDLATLWHHFTGHSFVFAAWIAKPGLQNRAELETLLESARDQGTRQIAAIVAQNPLQTSLSDAVVEDYLRHAIEYHLTPSHRAGMSEFARRLEKPIGNPDFEALKCNPGGQKMSVKDQIKARVDALDENEELKVLGVLDQLAAQRQVNEKPGLFDQLLEHQFDGPPDLSINFDRYASGELRWDGELRDE